MSPDQIDGPFDSIESTQDFMNILAETILDVMRELHCEHELARDAGLDRRARALELAVFKLKMLSCYVHKSRRTLNDLRTLRRLILNERLTFEQIAAGV